MWTLDEPATRNALHSDDIAELTRLVEESSRSGTVRAGILAGAHGMFASGGDLRELAGRTSVKDAEAIADAGFALCAAVEAAPFPVLAVIAGPALGGGAEVALACDMRIAEPAAIVSFRHVRMGVSTAWGGASRLVALVGTGHAARLLYTGRDVGAEEAQAMGLVDAIAEKGHGPQLALAWAAEIARGAPQAVASMKRLVRHHAAQGVRELERELFVATWTSPDHHEAVSAHFERRVPGWK